MNTNEAKIILQCRGIGYTEVEFNEALEMAYSALDSSLPSNLDEVAKKIAYDVCKALPNGEEKDTVVYYAIQAAMAAAKWMAGQGETKEGIVVDNNDFIDFGDNLFIDVCPTLDKKAFNLHDGEKVIVQIRKKEE